MSDVKTFKGRPCLVTGTFRRSHPNPKLGPFQAVSLRFLDGLQPATGWSAEGKFKAKAKAVRDGEALVWRRFDELVRVHKMEPKRAGQQARAELAKGVLAVHAAPGQAARPRADQPVLLDVTRDSGQGTTFQEGVPAWRQNRATIT